MSRQLCMAFGPGLRFAELPLSAPAAARRFAVMKDSFPKLRAPPDPSKPSVSRVMQGMISNQKVAVPGTGDERYIQGSGGSETRGQQYSRHLPASYLPKSTGPPTMAARGSMAASSGTVVGSSRQQWRPPGWQEGSKASSPEKASEPNSMTGMAKDPFKYELGERPAAEIWGMRAIAALVVVVLYLELRDVSIGPNGKPTRKIRPDRNLSPQEELELQQKQLQQQK
ncbi:unnamed protein product [Polarella glacialis]|uniref:Uncharacterized protein n=1 Tax=Polarella glacialis TaxID=89957 RepID=A0A813J1L4_POLGL|nr:unnamed protein product [Polarella glacialis]CAE8662341.1 unnamed protein product [Polarella glacialis]|mmetsp:Transcript_30848/g.55208  ORF Transcript_30848/g.55208 Transcript_30848/m.55208 type:complete len:226 (-) Transcript_30848:27-704(-)